jgi:hypothetical protein
VKESTPAQGRSPYYDHHSRPRPDIEQGSPGPGQRRLHHRLRGRDRKGSKPGKPIRPPPPSPKAWCSFVVNRRSSAWNSISSGTGHRSGFHVVSGFLLDTNCISEAVALSQTQKCWRGSTPLRNKRRFERVHFRRHSQRHRGPGCREQTPGPTGKHGSISTSTSASLAAFCLWDRAVAERG